jgi:group I intron endonuclease
MRGSLRGSGIYWIRNKNNGKFYIGSAADIKRRWWNHRSLLRRGEHDNVHLQRAWAKHGEAAFEFAVIEDVPVNQLLTVEQWYLDNTRCLEDSYGYNLNISADGSKHSEETKKKIGDANRGRKRSEATLKKMSASWTPERRAKVGEALRLRNLGNSHNKGKKGQIPWNKGLTKLVISKAA